MDSDSKACPVCGETIKAVALKCRYCGTDLAAYAQQKDAETEREIFHGHPAVFYSAGMAVPFILALVAAVLLGYFLRDQNWTAYIALGFMVAWILIYLHFYFRSRALLYSITTQRIKLTRGLLSKVQESLELFRVDHFELRQPWGMRLLGQASLHLFSSDAEFQNFYIYGIPGLEQMSDQLRECQLRERQRRGLTTFVKA